MKVIDVYSAARCVWQGVERRAVLVRLTATSDAGEIRYDAGLSFFPHRTEDDFSVSYDAAAEKELYRAPGRRSKKREAALLETIRTPLNELAESLGGEIFWDTPLREARFG